MKIFLNVLWYFPFFGFLWGIGVFLLGLLLCVTIVGLPLGLGLLQFAKFLFMPFTHKMIDQKLIMVATDEQSNQAYQVFATIVRIIYFPFGLLNLIMAAFAGLVYCITIIGIPMGLVLFRSLSTYFNPVNKICIPISEYDSLLAAANDPVRKEQIMAEMAEKERCRLERQEAMIAQIKSVKNRLWPYRWYIVGAIAFIVILCIVGHYTSDEYRYETGWKAKIEGRADDAVKYFKKISPSDDIHYCGARTYVFDYYRLSNPSIAGKIIKETYEKVSTPGSLFYGRDDVAERYAEALITGDYEPAIHKDVTAGVNVALTMKYPTERIVGILFTHKQYDAVKALSDIYVERSKHDPRTINIIYGYRGLIYLYGLGSTPRDFKEAANNLYCVNDCPLFGLPCGDVRLLNSGYGLQIGTIDDIYNMYYKAGQLEWNEATNYILKKRILTLKHLIEAYDTYDYDGWNTPERYWNSVYTGYYEGYYVGVVGRMDFKEIFAGYGVYSWLKKNDQNVNYANEMMIGLFDDGRFVGEMLYMYRTQGGMQSVYNDYGGEEIVADYKLLYNGDIILNNKTYEFDPTYYAPRRYEKSRGSQKKYANEYQYNVYEIPWDWENLGE